MGQDSPLSIAASVAGLLTFAAAILLYIYARAVSRLKRYGEVQEALWDIAMAVRDIEMADRNIINAKDETSNREIIEMYFLSLILYRTILKIIDLPSWSQASQFEKKREVIQQMLRDLSKGQARVRFNLQYALHQRSQCLSRVMDDLVRDTISFNQTTKRYLDDIKAAIASITSLSPQLPTARSGTVEQPGMEDGHDLKLSSALRKPVQMKDLESIPMTDSAPANVPLSQEVTAREVLAEGRLRVAQNINMESVSTTTHSRPENDLFQIALHDFQRSVSQSEMLYIRTGADLCMATKNLANDYQNRRSLQWSHRIVRILGI